VCAVFAGNKVRFARAEQLWCSLLTDVNWMTRRPAITAQTAQSPAQRRCNKTTCNSESAYTSAQVNAVQIRNVTGTSLYKDTSVIKFLRRSDRLIRELWATLWKNALLAMWNNLSKKLLDQDPEVADFLNLISSSLTRYICEKTSRNEVPNRQIDRHKRQALHNLLGR